jgi:small conductance mechanosensitive channel
MDRSWFDAAGLIGKLANEAMERIPYFVIALAVFVLFVLLGKMLRRIIRIATGNSLKHRNLGIVMGRLAFGFTVLLGLLIALVIVVPGFTPGQLVNLLGLSSVAIGFAFRDILQNFLAGILLLLTQPFRIGDQIVVGTFEGTVEEIETRATFLRTYDGRRIVIPNSKLFTESVTVNTANDARRMQYDISIGNSDNIATAKRIMLETVRATPDVLDDPPPDAIVVELAESAVNIRIRWWVHPPRQMELLTVQDQVLERVKDALTAEGIDLPYPTRQILFHDQTEETDGDRSRQREGWPQGGKEIPASARIVDALKALQPLRGKEEGGREGTGGGGSQPPR